jgi:hypothetical protein
LRAALSHRDELRTLAHSGSVQSNRPRHRVSEVETSVGFVASPVGVRHAGCDRDRVDNRITGWSDERNRPKYGTDFLCVSYDTRRELCNDNSSHFNATCRLGRLKRTREEDVENAMYLARQRGRDTSSAGWCHATGGQQFVSDGRLLDMRSTRGVLTLGGAVAAPIHGRHLSCSSSVDGIEALKVVLADGSLMERDRRRNRELFSLTFGDYEVFLASLPRQHFGSSRDKQCSESSGWSAWKTSLAACKGASTTTISRAMFSFPRRPRIQVFCRAACSPVFGRSIRQRQSRTTRFVVRRRIGADRYALRTKIDCELSRIWRAEPCG